MIRFRKPGDRPKRTTERAPTCGEETTHAFDGADRLAKNRPALSAADAVRR